MSQRHSIDSATVRDSRLFGWGWFLDDSSPADDIRLEIGGRDGTLHSVRCPQGGSRPDLEEAYPQVAHAGSGGFMMQARLPDRAQIGRIELCIRLRDGRNVRVPMPALEQACSSTETGAGAISTGSGWRRLQLALQLLRHARWGALWNRAWRFIQRHLVAARAEDDASMPGMGRVGAWVVFDHAMGGGTNRFRDERIAEWRGAGIGVMLVTPVLATLEYEVSWLDGQDRLCRRRFPDLHGCLEAIGRCARVIVNNLVSYDDPLQVLEWAVKRRAKGASLCFYVHDFHAACPAWTLIDDEGKYCGLPAFERCASCIRANPAPFLALMPSLDLPAWRRAWGAFLSAADEIIAFSGSSATILAQAYPALDLERIVVAPHSTEYLGEAPPAFVPALGEIATIGVVGAISEPKGARVVAEMAAIIEREGLPARIVVIGTIDGASASSALRVVGPYQTSQLPGLLAREAISVAFLPSIVHETFSYVTAELMHHQVPLAVFDLGAPAERVRGYPLGRIISRVDARTALTELLAFHHELSAAAASRAAGPDVP